MAFVVLVVGGIVAYKHFLAPGGSGDVEDIPDGFGYDFGKVHKVAIIEVSGVVRSDAVKNQIGDFFGTELLAKGYTPIDLALVQSLFKEHTPAFDWTTDEGSSRAGRILNVPAVMLVDIHNYSEEEMKITARMIDVADGSILWVGAGSASGVILGGAAGDTLSPQQAEQVNEIIKHVCKSLPSRVVR